MTAGEKSLKYITFWKRQNDRDYKNMSDARRLGGRGGGTHGTLGNL